VEIASPAMGIWIDITPKGKDPKGWHFAYYVETPSEREDGKWYSAFLFRNDARSQFGIRECLGELYKHQSVRHMAMRVLKEPHFRESLLSDRKDLPKWWKRR
jgi:hypothetical protein